MFASLIEAAKNHPKTARIIVLSAFIQALAIQQWNAYRDRFLLGSGVLIAGMILIECILFALYRRSILADPELTPARSWKIVTAWAGVAVVAALGLGLVTGAEIYFANHPLAFAKEEFGVAIATFDGGDAELAAQLSACIKREWDDLNIGSLKDYVKVRSVGVIRSPAEADADAQRYNAKLIIWGEVHKDNNQVNLNFKVLESLDQLSNPNFPRLVPLVNAQAEGNITIDRKDPCEGNADMKAIAGLVTGIAEFSKWNFRASARAFESEPIKKLVKDSYLLYLYRGLTMQQLDRMDDAIAAFNAAIQIIPDDPGAHLGLAFTYNSIGNDQLVIDQATQAIVLCRKSLSTDPNNALAYYDLALAYVLKKDADIARDSFKAAVRINPGFISARLGIVRMEIQTKQYTAAQTYAQETVAYLEEAHLNPAWAYFYLGRALQSNIEADPDNALDNARIAYEQAVAYGPYIDWILHDVGIFEWQIIRDENAALKLFERMLAVTRLPAWGFDTLAKFYLGKNEPDLEKALDYFQQALNSAPSRPSLVMVDIANVYFKQQKYDNARAYFQRALQEDPDSIYGLSSYGTFLFDQGDIAGARAQFEHAVKVNPTDCSLRLSLGATFQALDQIPNACQQYRDTLTLAKPASPSSMLLGVEGADASPDLAACQEEAQRRLAQLGGKCP